MTDPAQTSKPAQWWYNSKTGEVEEGMLSPATVRVGPFASRAEAEHAPQRLAERSRAWAEEEAAAEDD